MSDPVSQPGSQKTKDLCARLPYEPRGLSKHPGGSGCGTEQGGAGAGQGGGGEKVGEKGSSSSSSMSRMGVVVVVVVVGAAAAAPSSLGVGRRLGQGGPGSCSSAWHWSGRRRCSRAPRAEAPPRRPPCGPTGASDEQEGGGGGGFWPRQGEVSGAPDNAVGKAGGTHQPSGRVGVSFRERFMSPAQIDVALAALRQDSEALEGQEGQAGSPEIRRGSEGGRAPALLPREIATRTQGGREEGEEGEGGREEDKRKRNERKAGDREGCTWRSSPEKAG